MKRLKQIVALFAGLACLQASAEPVAKNDSLLIALSARKLGSWGNQVGEAAAAITLKRSFKGRYKRIEIWMETSGEPALSALKRMVETRAEGERLDIFVVGHGPDPSLLPGISRREAEAIVPPGFLRRYFSTACSQWGTLKRKGAVFTPDYVSSFPLHLRRLGASEYVIYANDNGTWLAAILLFARNMALSDSWLSAGFESSRVVDDWIARRLVGRLSEFSPYKKSLRVFAQGRPVLGGAEIEEQRSIVESPNVVPVKTNDFVDLILLPSPALSRALWQR